VKGDYMERDSKRFLELLELMEIMDKMKEELSFDEVEDEAIIDGDELIYKKLGLVMIDTLNRDKLTMSAIEALKTIQEIRVLLKV
jgi:hypothetical protein